MKQHRTKGDGNNKCTHGIARGQEGEQLAAIKEDNTGEAKRNITHMRQRLAKWKWRLDKTQGRQDDARK